MKRTTRIMLKVCGMWGAGMLLIVAFLWIFVFAPAKRHWDACEEAGGVFLQQERKCVALQVIEFEETK